MSDPYSNPQAANGGMRDFTLSPMKPPPLPGAPVSPLTQQKIEQQKMVMGAEMNQNNNNMGNPKSMPPSQLPGSPPRSQQFPGSQDAFSNGYGGPSGSNGPPPPNGNGGMAYAGMGMENQFGGSNSNNFSNPQMPGMEPKEQKQPGFGGIGGYGASLSTPQQIQHALRDAEEYNPGAEFVRNTL
jgi:hypothetical protein